MRAKPDGFELVFTEPVDPARASNVESYRMDNYTYLYSGAYGSDELNKNKNPITEAIVSADELSVYLKVDSLKPHYVHELHAEGVVNRMGEPLLHSAAYYTLNRIPQNDCINS